jgi:SAM-dependent methyltransferase
MTGLDLSESMLALARTKAEAREVDVSWTRGDMTLFSLGRSFDTILLPAQSTSHLSGREELEGLFDAVRRSLKRDGTFVFELFCPSIELLAGAETPETAAAEVLEHNGRRLRLTSTLTYDAAEQCSDCEFLLTDVGDGDETRLAFRMRQFFPRELDALVIYNGFEIIRKYGAHDMSPFDSTSPRQLLVCRPSGVSR